MVLPPVEPSSASWAELVGFSEGRRSCNPDAVDMLRVMVGLDRHVAIEVGEGELAGIETGRTPCEPLRAVVGCE